jgi:hypothetical protein
VGFGRRLWEWRDGVELVLTGVIIVLIGWEIHIAIAGGREQVKALEAINANLEAQGRVLAGLQQTQQEAVNLQGQALGLQKNSLKDIQGMGGTMRRQLSVLNSDQQQRLAEMAKKLALEIGGIRIAQKAGAQVNSVELKVIMQYTTFGSSTPVQLAPI